MSSAGAGGAGQQKKKRNNLDSDHRDAVVGELLRGSSQGKLAKGDIQRVAAQFNSNRWTIASVWKEYQQQKSDGVVKPLLRNKRLGNSGRKGIDVVKYGEALREIPIKNRTTIRSLAAALGIPHSTLHLNLKKLGLHASKTYLKPMLKEEGMRKRLEWAVRWVLTAPPELGGGHKFQDFLNFVHLDEKWFYICKNGQKYYLHDDEDVPTRKVQHKSHITKVMFLAVVARPRFDPHRQSMFSGKIGIFPFTELRQAVRSSARRAAGTWETKCVEVTKERYKEKLIQNVIPAIKRDWPRARRGETIWAQHDNAPSHNLNEDPDIVRECTADGWDIKFISQPANSPDLNILDLGFFNSIQSLQDRTTPRTIDDLIAEVRTAFGAQTSEKLGAVWTTLQSILQEIMLAKGDNTFKLPHLKKASAVGRGVSIPMELPCSQEAWEAAQSTLPS